MSEKILVVGAVALGPKAACRAKRLKPKAEIILIDQQDRISYGGCGIPYFVSGEVNRVEDLQTTPYGAVRDAEFFKKYKGITALTQTQMTKINRDEKSITVKNLISGKEEEISYDKLVLALGSRPNMPPIPGIELKGISPATNLDEAELIRTAVQGAKVNNAVVVGGGFIGLEMAVALADMWGVKTTVVELADQIMPGFMSATLAKMSVRDLAAHDVEVFTGESVRSFQGENGQVKKVITDKRTLDADLVIMAAGIRPNTELARAAGLDLNERGLIRVNEYMQTSDPDIYSGGDCVVVKNLVSEIEQWYPLGSMANRQGRVIGTNVAGGKASFPGAVGSWGMKLFDLYATGAGLNIANAKALGYDAINVHVEQLDKAHFYPEKTLLCLELVVDKKSSKVLGIQGVGGDGNALAARINAVAPLLCRGCQVSDISNLEVLYSPPFSSAMDIINVVGNVAENIIAGRLDPMTQEEFAKTWKEREENDAFFLDSRAYLDAESTVKKLGKDWHNIPQDEIKNNLDKIPRDRPLVLICNTGLRSFEAQRDLINAGYTNTKSVMGGFASVERLGSMK